MPVLANPLKAVLSQVFVSRLIVTVFCCDCCISVNLKVSQISILSPKFPIFLFAYYFLYSLKLCLSIVCKTSNTSLRLRWSGQINDNRLKRVDFWSLFFPGDVVFVTSWTQQACLSWLYARIQCVMITCTLTPTTPARLHNVLTVGLKSNALAGSAQNGLKNNPLFYRIHKFADPSPRNELHRRWNLVNLRRRLTSQHSILWQIPLDTQDSFL